MIHVRGFEGWIEGAEKKITVGYPSPNNMEEATTMVEDCKVAGWWRNGCWAMDGLINEGWLCDRQLVAG